MPSVLSLKEIEELNPSLDMQRVREFSALGKELKASGMTGKSSKLGFGQPGPRARFDEDAQNESRLVRLRHSK